MRKPGAKSLPRRKFFGLKHGFSFPHAQIKKSFPGLAISILFFACVIERR
jgi:hypothetical protein